MSEILTEESAPGCYLVVTASQTVYVVRIADDRELSVVRRPIVHRLLLDGEPMSGVTGFDFDGATGVGSIRWTKLDPADYDYPDVPYMGTTRSTSPVLLVAKVRDDEDFIDAIRSAVQATTDREVLHDILRTLVDAGTSQPDE